MGNLLVSSRFSHLSLPQVSGLATWSFGIVMAQSSSLTRVSNLIAKINAEPENTVRQRLKEWYKEVVPFRWPSNVVKATAKGSWQPHWKQLFQSLKNILPRDWKVIVSADRGLYADWLYHKIVELGWHPTSEN